MEPIAGTWRAVAVASAALSIGAACAFLTMPEDVAKDRYTREVRDYGLDTGDPLRTVTKLRDAVAADFDRANLFAPTGGEAFATTFLHLSDAQIRDEKLHATWGRGLELRGADLFVSSSIRPPLVDKFDALTLGAFLVAQDKRIQKEGALSAQFAVHTGDLLDISAATEAIVALRLFRDLLQPPSRLTLYSVAGNHDGLRFGTVHDRYTGEDYGICVNRTEVVLAHLMLDEQPGRGFGYGANELIPAPGRDLPLAIRPREPLPRERLPVTRLEALGRQRDRLGRAMLRSAPPQPEEDQLPEEGQLPEENQHPDDYDLRVPIGLKQKMEFPRADDLEAEQVGYYAFKSRGAVPGATRVRHLVLDTRASDSHQGYVGWVQIGWLYNELVAALKKREIVVLFAHHGPADFRRCLGFFSCPETRALERMLDAFPHLVGYFHGHLHRNEEGFWRDDPARFPLIQTGSIADFPQVGRLVWIETVAADDGSAEAKIRWDFVRPQGDELLPKGRLLNALLTARCEEALEDLGARGARKRSIRTCGTLGEELEDEREQLQGAFPNVRVGFEAAPGDISPEAIFGSHLEEVDLRRSELGLAKVTRR